MCGTRVTDSTPDTELAALRLNRLGFVFQTFNLISGMTALENVEMPLTLHGALSPSEQALAVSPVGVNELQEYRRRLFETSAAEFRHKIKEITGVEVCAVADEIEPKSGTAVTVFSSGTVVQVFMLAGGVATESWSGKTTGPAA